MSTPYRIVLNNDTEGFQTMEARVRISAGPMRGASAIFIGRVTDRINPRNRDHARQRFETVQLKVQVAGNHSRGTGKPS